MYAYTCMILPLKNVLSLQVLLTSADCLITAESADVINVCVSSPSIIALHVCMQMFVRGQGVYRHRHVNPCKVGAGIIKPIA